MLHFRYNKTIAHKGYAYSYCIIWLLQKSKSFGSLRSIAFLGLCLSTQSQLPSLGDLYNYCFQRDYACFLHMKITCFFLGRSSPHRVWRNEKAITGNIQLITTIAFILYYGWDYNYQTSYESHLSHWYIDTGVIFPFLFWKPSKVENDPLRPGYCQIDGLHQY